MGLLPDLKEARIGQQGVARSSSENTEVVGGMFFVLSLWLMYTVLSSLELGLFVQETFCYRGSYFFFFWRWLPFLLSICIFLTLQVHSSVKLICLLSYLRDSYQSFAVDYLPPIRNLQVYQGGNWA